MQYIEISVTCRVYMSSFQNMWAKFLNLYDPIGISFYKADLTQQSVLEFHSISLNPSPVVSDFCHIIFP